MNLERIEKLIEEIREAINSPTLTDKEKLEMILEIVDIFRGPPADLTARQDIEALLRCLLMVDLATHRNSGVRH